MPRLYDPYGPYQSFVVGHMFWLAFVFIGKEIETDPLCPPVLNNPRNIILVRSEDYGFALQPWT